MISQEKIRVITEYTKAFLGQEIDALKERQIAAMGRVVMSDKMRGKAASLLIMDCFTSNLPKSLELFTYEPEPISQTSIGNIRGKFNKASGRKGILKWAYMSEQENLKKMGLQPNHVEFLEQGYVPRTLKGKLMDLTVDHIVEISHGGKNDHENLCILPDYLNLYKCTFTQIQIRAGLAEILGIRPKANDDGTPVVVPVLKGGFRTITSNGPLIRSRMEELVGMKLQ